MEGARECERVQSPAARARSRVCAARARRHAQRPPAGSCGCGRRPACPCAAGGRWQKAVSLFDEMLSWGIKPDVVSCTALITALGTDGQWERAEKVGQ